MSYSIIFIFFMRRCDWCVCTIYTDLTGLAKQTKGQRTQHVSMDTRSYWTLINILLYNWMERSWRVEEWLKFPSTNM